MKLHYIIFFVVLFWGGCSASSDNLLSVEERKSPIKQNKMEESNLNSIQEKEILSRNYQIAQKALEKAIKEKDKDTLRSGLKNQNPLIKKKVVDAISDIDFKDSVPDLIDALKRNQILLRGGTEVQLLQRDLDVAIVKTLEKLTQLDFDVTDALSSEDVNKVIEQSNRWWNDYKKKKTRNEF